MRLDSSRWPSVAARHALVSRSLRTHAPACPRVLLLTSGLGLGHVRAAQAIEAALENTAEVQTLDLWSLMNPGVASAVHATYLALVQNYPQLYERLYHLDEQTWRQILESESGPPREVLEVLELISAIAAECGERAPRGGRYASDRMLLSLLCAALPYDGESLAGNGVRARLALMKWTWLRLIRRLEPAIRRFAPHAIVSTQMIPAAMTCYLRQRGKVAAPVVGIITDFGVHDFWQQRGIDCYCVAHDEMLSCMSPGAPHAARVATGVPLMPGFVQPPPQPQARRELGLPDDVPVVLVLGGGLGLSVDTVAAMLLGRQSGMHLIAMAGQSAGVRNALALLARRHRQRLRVCEWTERMEVFLSAADVVVGKPGGISVAEALACGRPMLATRSLGGQEGFNVDFLERHGVGGLVADGELLDRLDALLGERSHLEAMQRRARLLGRPHGAIRIAQLVADLAAAHTPAALPSP